MYMVEGLEHIDKYIIWAKQKYPKARFISVPHYALTQYIKDGAFGCEQDPKQRIKRLSDITEDVRAMTGIEWAIYGFKQTDSLNRRIMLRTYEQEMINEATKKATPLALQEQGRRGVYQAQEAHPLAQVRQRAEPRHGRIEHPVPAVLPRQVPARPRASDSTLPRSREDTIRLP